MCDLLWSDPDDRTGKRLDKISMMESNLENDLVVNLIE